MEPFCGNDLTAQASGLAIGVCGSCQVDPRGGGEASQCTSNSTDEVDCPQGTSCPPDTVCCATGECATGGAAGASGERCTTTTETTTTTTEVDDEKK